MTTTARQPVTSVEELKRAWLAVTQGQFRTNTNRVASPQATQATDAARWSPHEPTVAVVGCGGGSGATTASLAIATAHTTAHTGPVRVVECCSVTQSGLAAASSSELGLSQGGWSRGSRGPVLLERVTDVLTCAAETPCPSQPDEAVALTVLDVGWELGQVLTSPGWLAGAVQGAAQVVLTATATIPSLRRLEAAVQMLGPVPVCAAVLGPARKKWPRALQHSAGAVVRELEDDGALVMLPLDAHLAVSGLTPAGLPTPLLKAVTPIVQRVAERTL